MTKTIDQMSILEIENHLIERRVNARPTVGDLKKAIADLPDNLLLNIEIMKGDVEFETMRTEQYEVVTHFSIDGSCLTLVSDESMLDADIDGDSSFSSAAMYKAWKGAANG